MKEKIQFDSLGFIRDFIRISPRQYKNEIRAANFIAAILKKNRIVFSRQKFIASIPLVRKKSMVVDGRKIECEAGCFVSGTINDKSNLASSLFSSANLIETESINFNPKSDGICVCNHSFAPSIAVSRRDVGKIMRAKRIKGEIRLEKVKYETSNILVGNTKSPENICFAHYDSIGKGAIDNASGVATLLSAILKNPKLLENNLFVFSAVEEMSYDNPVYWGYGYRQFEKEYGRIMDKARKIIIIDCVGHSLTEKFSDPSIVKLAFPVINFDKISKKSVVLSGDFNDLMTVYHSNLDDGRKIKKAYLKDAENELLRLIGLGDS